MSEDSVIPKYAAVSSTSIPSGKEEPSPEPIIQSPQQPVQRSQPIQQHPQYPQPQPQPIQRPQPVNQQPWNQPVQPTIRSGVMCRACGIGLDPYWRYCPVCGGQNLG